MVSASPQQRAAGSPGRAKPAQK